MATLNKYQLYSINHGNLSSLVDEVSKVQEELDNINDYFEVKQFVDKHFKKVQKAGDVQVAKFRNTDKMILCQIFDNETIFFMVKSDEATEPEWTKLTTKS